MTTSYVSITINTKETFQEEKYLIKISHSLARYWKITKEKIHYLCIGTVKVPIAIEFTHLQKYELEMSELLLSEVFLPLKKIRLLSQYDPITKTLYLGPTIGLMTEITVNDEETPIFQSIHSYCEELQHLVAKYGGFFFVFSIQNISNEGILGYFYDDNKWVEAKLPFPNVIYNRIHSRRLERHSLTKEMIKKIYELNIPIFNKQFLSKWEVHELLFSEPTLHSFLPVTYPFSKENLQFLLNDYNEIYLKPIHGSQGKNIFRLIHKNDLLFIESSTNSSIKGISTFSNLNRFTEWFKRYSEKKEYILQEAIPLLKFSERPLDFRVLCHRTYQHDWRVTSIIARIAAPTQFVSNIAKGGEMINAQKALNDLFQIENPHLVLKLMKELSLRIVTVISKDEKFGCIGELGIDIGVDEDGKLWIIEVNSKPSKSFSPEDGKQLRPSARAIIEYSTALAFKYMRQIKG